MSPGQGQPSVEKEAYSTPIIRLFDEVGSGQQLEEERREPSECFAAIDTLSNSIGRQPENVQCPNRPETHPEELQKPRGLRCPFHAADIVRYNACGNHRSLFTMRRVKQHLRQHHLDGSTEDGSVTDALAKWLPIRLDGNKTQGENWYQVFHMLFPTHRRPADPYVFEPLQELLADLQQSLLVEGPNELRRIFESDLLRGVHMSADFDEKFGAAFTLVVPTLLSRWRETNGIRYRQPEIPEMEVASAVARLRDTISKEVQVRENGKEEILSWLAKDDTVSRLTAEWIRKRQGAWTNSTQEGSEVSDGQYDDDVSRIDSADQASIFSRPYNSTSSTISTAPSVTARTSILAYDSVHETVPAQNGPENKRGKPNFFERPEFDAMPRPYQANANRDIIGDERQRGIFEGIPPNFAHDDFSDELSSLDEDDGCQSTTDLLWGWAVSALIELSGNDVEFEHFHVRFISAIDGQSCQSSGNAQADASATFRGGSRAPQASQSIAKGKRPLQSDGEDDDDDNEQGGKRLPPAKRGANAKSNGRSLACLYYRYDPVKYAACVQKNYLWTNARLNQHLVRIHSASIHCSLCLQPFATNKEIHFHLYSGTCPGANHDRPPVEGISEEVMKEVRAPASANSDPEKEWRRKYRLVFPDDHREHDPYLPIALGELQRAMHEYFCKRGPAILIQMAESYGITAHECVLNMDDIFQHTVGECFRRWGAARNPQPSGVSTNAPPTPLNQPAGPHQVVESMKESELPADLESVPGVPNIEFPPDITFNLDHFDPTWTGSWTYDDEGDAAEPPY